MTNTCSYCSKIKESPRGFKYYTLQGKESFYCSRRCYIFTYDSPLTKNKIKHLSTLRIKKNKDKALK